MTKWERYAPNCGRVCGYEEDLETIDHLLCHCPSILSGRPRILGELIVPCLKDISSIDPRIILDLIKDHKCLKTIIGLSYIISRFLYVCLTVCLSEAHDNSRWD